MGVNNTFYGMKMVDIPDENRITKAEARALDTRQSNCQRLTKGAFFEGDIIGKTMKPLCGVQMPPCQST